MGAGRGAGARGAGLGGGGGAGLGGGGTGGAGGAGGEMNSLSTSAGTITSAARRSKPDCKAHSPATCSNTTEPAMTALRLKPPEEPYRSNWDIEMSAAGASNSGAAGLKGQVIYGESTRPSRPRGSGCQRVLRGVPCFAFHDGFGKLDRLRDCFFVQRGHGMRHTALLHHGTSAVFTTAALRGDTQFKLDFVEAHARMRMACNFAVRNTVADTDDHGQAVLAGC